MAETLKIPNTVVDSDWKDDVDVDYAIYGGNEKNEREYIPQAEINKKSASSPCSVSLMNEKPRKKERESTNVKQFDYP